jgi:ribokinase
VVFNPAPVTERLPQGWLEASDFVIPNEIEAAALSGVKVDSPETARDAAWALREQGARTVIITLGGQGVFVLAEHDGQGAGTHHPARRVNAVDTTAAGDTFVGGFAATLASGSNVDDPLWTGCGGAIGHASGCAAIDSASVRGRGLAHGSVSVCIRSAHAPHRHT